MSKNVESIYHLSPMQHAMLLQSRRAPGSGVYVEQFICTVAGQLDIAKFRDAWDFVVHRHDALKASFVRLHDENPLQVTRARVNLPFECHDWQTLLGEEQERRFERLLAEDRHTDFDLGAAPLLRVRLVQLGAGVHRLLWSYHHAILDGWSMPIVLREMFQHYVWAVEGRPCLLPKAPCYQSHVRWLRSQNMAEAKSFWQTQLSACPRDFSFSPAVAVSPRASERRLARVAAAMPASWLAAALKTCRAQKITLNTLCQGAWSVLLSLYGGVEDLVYGTVVSGRQAAVPEIEHIVGLFINTLPVRVRLPGDADVCDWLRDLQKLNQEIERHGQLPLVDILSCADNHLGAKPLFDSIYVFESYPGQAEFQGLLAAHGLQIEGVTVNEETNYDLALIAVPDKGLRLQLVYDTAALQGPRVAELLERYQELLTRFVDIDRVRLRDVSIASSVSATSLAAASPAPGAAGERSDGPGETLSAMVHRAAAAFADRLICSGLTQGPSYRTFATLVGHYVAEWTRRGFRRGDRVALLSADPVLALALLISAIECGVVCVITECPTADMPTPLAGRVVVQASADGPGEVRWTKHETAASAPVESALAAAAEGGCALIGATPSGDVHSLRYGEQQIVFGIRRMIRRYAVGAARSVPIAGSPLRPRNLWTSLFALCSGLTIQLVGEEENFLDAAGTGAEGWHSLRLDAAQTRALCRLPTERLAAIKTDYWAVDAASMTPAALQDLVAIGGTTVVRELRWPILSLPHAWIDANPLSASDIHIVDRHFRRAATGTWGFLAITGATLPAEYRINGVSQIGSLRSASPPRPLIVSEIRGWAAPSGDVADWPAQTMGALSADPNWARLENALQRLPGVVETAAIERLSDRRDWELVVFYAVQGLDVDEDQIRSTVAAMGLPAATLIQLARLPRTETGAVDRHALIAGAFKPERRARYAAPTDDVERELQQIWQSLLKHETIGIDANYFDLGG
jgi:myxalamid-type nonribosomal peptide synthetase MxaA